MTLQTTEFPWSTLDCPLRRGDLFSRLANPNAPVGSSRVFWARSWNNLPCLIIEYEQDGEGQESLPTFQLLQIYDVKGEQELVIELLDEGLADLFHQLGLDLIQIASKVSKTSARSACLKRLRLWNAFLRKSNSGLSPQEQKGLIAELLFLERVPLRNLSSGAAIQGWSGPLASPRDFEYGQTSIEVKAKKNPSSKDVIISSAEQLTTHDQESLFLYVVELNEVDASISEAFSLHDVAVRVREQLVDPFEQLEFDFRLSQAGYMLDGSTQSLSFWTEGTDLCFRVADSFPRIESKGVPEGVTKVRYSINLDSCFEYRCDNDAVSESLKG